MLFKISLLPWQYVLLFSTAVSATAVLVQSVGSEQKLQAFNESDTNHTPCK